MGDNERQVIRSEDTVVAGQPEQTTVSQTQTNTASATPAQPAYVAPAASTTHSAHGSTMQTTTTAEAPSDRVVSHNVAERVIDPASEKSATVDWINRLVWFIFGVMAILLAIRFVLLASGANEAAGFAQLIYGLTDWMVAPFAGLFGSAITYPGAAGTGIIEFESIVAIVVYLLIAFAITKIAQLALGTNRTTGTVYNETDRTTKL
jgi:YggT family protein